MGMEELTFVMSLSLLLCYLTAILFRVGVLVLIMAYLCVYAIVPLLTLLIGMLIFWWMSFRKEAGGSGQSFGIFLIVSDLGVVTLYTNPSLNKTQENVKKFVMRSSTFVFFHHCIILTLILAIGWHYPTSFGHWESLDFPVKPSTEIFNRVFILVLVMGCLSQTTIFYRAGKITNINDDQKNGNEAVENLKEVHIQEPQNKHNQK